MAISADISDLSWLRQPNPGEFGLKSMQVGLEAGRSFMSAYNEAQQNKRENALSPLRQAILTNQVKNTALDIQKGLLDQESFLQAKAGSAELSRVASEISKDAAWAEPAAGEKIWEVGSKYPALLSTPQFRAVASQVDAAKLAKQQLEQKKFEAGIVKAQSDRESRETIANITASSRTEVQKLKNEGAMNKLIADSSDQFDSSAKRREFSEGVRAIFKRDDLSYESKLQEAEGLRVKLREGKPVSKSGDMSEDNRSVYDALMKEISSIRTEMNDLKVDLAKNPKKPLMDFGKDNRVAKMEELKGQMDSLNTKAKEYLGSPLSKPSSPAPDDEMIWVKSPDGRKGRIPKANLEKALKQGYSIYEG